MHVEVISHDVNEPKTGFVGPLALFRFYQFLTVRLCEIKGCTRRTCSILASTAVPLASSVFLPVSTSSTATLTRFQLALSEEHQSLFEEIVPDFWPDSFPWYQEPWPETLATVELIEAVACYLMSLTTSWIWKHSRTSIKLCGYHLYLIPITWSCSSRAIIKVYCTIYRGSQVLCEAFMNLTRFGAGAQKRNGG